MFFFCFLFGISKKKIWFFFLKKKRRVIANDCFRSIKQNSTKTKFCGLYILVLFFFFSFELRTAQQDVPCLRVLQILFFLCSVLLIFFFFESPPNRTCRCWKPRDTSRKKKQQKPNTGEKKKETRVTTKKKTRSPFFFWLCRMVAPIGLASDFWGATWWFILKSCCTHGSNESLQLKLLVEIVPQTLPCGICRGHYRSNLAEIRSSGGFGLGPAQLVCHMHNLVNISRNATCALFDYSEDGGCLKYLEWFGNNTEELRQALRFFFRFVVEAFPDKSMTWTGDSRKESLLCLIELVRQLLPCVLFEAAPTALGDISKDSFASTVDQVLGPGTGQQPVVAMSIFHSTSCEDERIDQLVWAVRNQVRYQVGLF